ncbi:MAG: glycerate kinase [Lachnospiraceae bacterium]|nr:glycerate kinase [Lachnospiraceae bacterium]
MKVVIAIDSLKGSLSSMEAGRAIERGVRKALPQAEVLVKPVADGGEGTTEAFVDGMGGEPVQTKVHGPLETPVTAEYGLLRESGTAIMEMAAAAGIILIGKDKRPLDATTYGVGEMIRDAIGRGCRDFIVGIGGSATNDGGIGMLAALGYEFLDEKGEPAGISASALGKVASIRMDKVIPELKDCHFRVACDVNNPLCGETGATYIFGPQKGVTEDIKEQLDQDMASFAKVAVAATGRDCTLTAGAGAAGGLGYAFLTFLNTDLQPGIELVMSAVEMDRALEGADLVFTGEGRLDQQTAMGKVPVGIAKMAKKHGAKVVALAGSIAPGAEACNENGIDAFFPILRGVCTLDEAMYPGTAAQNMENTAEQVARLAAALS